MLKSFSKISILGVLLILFVAGCDQKKSSSSEVIKKELVLKQAPVFNSDSAYQYIADQVGFGARVPNTRPHVACGDYLIEKLETYGTTVTVQAFDAYAYNGAILKSRNIIGAINPEAKKRIILAAHWDTRPYADQDDEKQKQPIDGANDGASGVGVLLELARAVQASELKPSVGVDIIFFDSEDYGRPEFEEDPNATSSGYCLGSEYWSKNKHKMGYHAYYGILLDMVGASNATFLREGVSMEFAPTVVEKVWGIAGKLGYGQHFLYEKGPQIMDDHQFVNINARIPMIDIIDLDVTGERTFFKHWHTHEDNLNTIDKGTLKAVGQTLLQVVYNE